MCQYCCTYRAGLHSSLEHTLNPHSFSSPSSPSTGIKHRKNEIFLDVVEKLNLLVSSNGTVLHSEIIGSVQMKSFLSGERIGGESSDHRSYCPIRSPSFLCLSLLRPSLSSFHRSLSLPLPLSGMPELKLGLNDKLMFEATGRSQSR